MDVLCVGMYRACSTWQYEVLAHLLEEHRGATRLGYLTGDEYASIDPAPAGTWRILKSHEEHASFARTLREGRGLAIYAHRDVRDVVYSLMHKRKATFDVTLRTGMIHQILVNDRFWVGQVPALTQRYDRLVAEPAVGVAELAGVVGIVLRPGEAEAVAAEYSFQANRERTERLGRQLRDGGVDLSDPAVAQAHDGRTLLHWNHLRDGRVGGWRGKASLEERRVLQRICGSWLAAHGYEPDDLPSDQDTVSQPARWVGRELGMLRGEIACRLRTMSLRHPRLARVVKRRLGISPDAPVAAPATTTIPNGVRSDHPVAVSGPLGSHATVNRPR